MCHRKISESFYMIDRGNFCILCHGWGWCDVAEINISVCNVCDVGVKLLRSVVWVPNGCDEREVSGV